MHEKDWQEMLKELSPEAREVFHRLDCALEHDQPQREWFGTIWDTAGFSAAADYALDTNEEDFTTPALIRFEELSKEERDAILKIQSARNRAWMRKA
jgi:hypothetical protein